MAAPILLALFIGVPIAEIVVLIEVGGVIGSVPTIGLIILTAVTGTFLIRYQGLGVINDVRRGVDAGAPPINPLIEGLFLLVAGALLLTPGFLTDAVGLACLVPPLRRRIAAVVWQRLARSGRARVIRPGPGPDAGPHPARDIEGEAIDLTPGPADRSDEPAGGTSGGASDGPGPDGDSPWSPDEPRR